MERILQMLRDVCGSVRFLTIALTALIALISAPADARESKTNDGMKGGVSLWHNKGQQSIGLRFEKGTKNMYGYGCVWQMCLNSKLGISAEVSREEAKFGETEFTADFLFGAGADWAVWHPTRWLFVNLCLQANVGHDTWHCADLPLNNKSKAWCYGLNGGLQLDFVPKKFLDIVLKAQQYMLFSSVEHYAKPVFSLRLKHVWNN